MKTHQADTPSTQAHTRQLACFCAGLDFGAIPGKVVEKSKWVLLDGLGVIVGATTLDYGRQMVRFVQALHDREEATVLGSGIKSSTRNAAFANGCLAETLEMQDGYTRGGVHPSSGTIPAALAMAEWHHASAKSFLAALVAGYEATNRVAEAMHPTHLARGFQPTGTAGTIGAAAASARLLGLSEEMTFNALGIAGFIAPVSTGDNLWGGYSVKPVHGGAAARSGIEAALHAQAGLEAAPLEGDAAIGKGFCRIMTNDSPQFDRMTDGLGQRFTMEDVYFKPHATCRGNQGPVDIALELRDRHKLNHQDIAEVLIRTYSLLVQTAGAVRTTADSTFTQCQFSMSFAVADALIFGKVGAEQLTSENIRNPQVQALASRIRIVADPELEHGYPASRPAIVDITLQDGRKLSGRGDQPKGETVNPMTETDLSTKFLDLTTTVIGKGKAEQAIELVLGLEKLDSLETLLALMAPGPAR